MNSSIMRNTCIASERFAKQSAPSRRKSRLLPVFPAKPFQISNYTPTTGLSGILCDSLDSKRKHDSISELDSSVDAIQHSSKENFRLSLEQSDAMDILSKANDGGKHFPFVDTIDAHASLIDFLDFETFAEHGQVETNDDVAVAPEEDLDWDVLSSLPFHETLLVPWADAAA